MTKIRDLIEKIWWVIPPIIVIFGIPLYDMLNKTIKYSGTPTHYDILMVPYTFISFGFLGGIILTIFFLGFTGYGYYLAKKQPSLLRRIIIPSILGIIGFYAGLFAIVIISGLTGGY